MHTRYVAVWSCLAALTLPCPAARAQQNAIAPSLIQKHVQGNIQEFFDLLALPNRRHGFGGEPYMIRRRWDYFVRYLAGNVPPNNYALKPWPWE